MGSMPILFIINHLAQWSAFVTNKKAHDCGLLSSAAMNIATLHIKSLAVTYFRMHEAYYHWRRIVSRPCSRWEGVVPIRYGRQT
jgi:hypothetical protein